MGEKNLWNDAEVIENFERTSDQENHMKLISETGKELWKKLTIPTNRKNSSFWSWRRTSYFSFFKTGYTSFFLQKNKTKTKLYFPF